MKRKAKVERNTIRKAILNEPDSQKKLFLARFNRVPGDLELWAMRYLDRNHPDTRMMLEPIFNHVTNQTGAFVTIEGYCKMVKHLLCEEFCKALDKRDIPAIKSVIELLQHPPKRDDNPVRCKLQLWKICNPGRSVYIKELAAEIRDNGPVEVLTRMAREEFGIEVKDGRKSNSDK